MRKNYLPRAKTIYSKSCYNHINARLEDKIKSIIFDYLNSGKINEKILLDSKILVDKVQLNESRSVCRVYWKYLQNESTDDLYQRLIAIGNCFQRLLPSITFNMGQRLNMKNVPAIIFEQLPK